MLNEKQMYKNSPLKTVILKNRRNMKAETKDDRSGKIHSSKRFTLDISNEIRYAFCFSLYLRIHFKK